MKETIKLLNVNIDIISKDDYNFIKSCILLQDYLCVLDKTSNAYTRTFVLLSNSINIAYNMNIFSKYQFLEMLKNLRTYI